jgi:hypothetical protein
LIDCFTLAAIEIPFELPIDEIGCTFVLILSPIDFFTFMDCWVAELPKFFDSFSNGSRFSVTIAVVGF